MITYQLEPYSLDFIQEAWDMMNTHWKEVGVFQDKMEFFPDLMAYEALHNEGYLRNFTARKDGMLIGYNVFTVNYHPHYAKTKVADNDIIYISKEHRKGTTGIRLMDYAEKELKKEGINLIMMRTKKEHDFGKILLRKGFMEVETVYGKYLED